MKDVVSGFGFHDVVIDTPFHGARLSDLGKGDAGQVILAYKKRVLQLKEIDAIKYVQVCGLWRLYSLIAAFNDKKVATPPTP